MKLKRTIAMSLICALTFNSSVINNSAVYAYEVCPTCKDVASVYNAPFGEAVNEKSVRLLVKRMYEICLNREATSEEMDLWARTLIDQEVTGCSMAYSFICGQEFINRNLCDDCYISVLYKGLLGREPDEHGKSNWFILMDNGLTREEILKEFTSSPEFQDYCRSCGIEPGSIELEEKEEEETLDSDFNYIYDFDFELEQYLEPNPDYIEGAEYVASEENVNELEVTEDISEDDNSEEAEETIHKWQTEPNLPITYINSEWFIDTSTRNNLDLVLWARMAYEEDWGYEYASNGQICDNPESDWYGHRIVDCSGLIKSYFWYSFDEGYFSWGLNGFTESSSETMWEHCTVYGEPETIPEMPGLGLWREGHVGIYMGNGMVIESSNSKDGMVIRAYNPENWTGWFEIPGLTYYTSYGDVRHDYDEHIIFGNYQGMPLSWTVVSRDDDGNMMLVSDYIIECMPYNDSQFDCDWENSTLRNWLNEKFYTMSFMDEEKGRVLTTSVSVGTDLVTTVEDKVYILSAQEMFRFYPYSNEAMCQFTFGANTTFNIMNDYQPESGICWLRDNGSSRIHNSASFMEASGASNIEGMDGSNYLGVRPVIRISAE